MGRPGLTRHRKFARLARLLGSEALARGHLELLWDVAYENGDELLGEAADVEYLARWKGEAGSLAAALTESGFLDEADGRYRVHDLWDHAPDYVAGRRSKEAERRKAKLCAACGAEYHSPDARSRYCSAACRTAKWRERVTDGDASFRHGDGGETEGDASPASRPQHPPPAPASGEEASQLAPPAANETPVQNRQKTTPPGCQGSPSLIAPGSAKVIATLASSAWASLGTSA